MALRGHIIVPTEPEGSDYVIHNIEKKASASLGGYSEYEGSGGWRDPDNGVVEEDHVRIVINCPDDHEMSRDQFVEHLKIEAEYVKDILNEECVMVEVEEVDLHFV